MTEDEMAGGYHCLNGHELEQTLGDMKDREDCCAAVHGSQRVGHNLATKQQQKA